MNGREAKQRAYEIACKLIESAIGTGGPTEGFDAEDERRVTKALHDIADSLYCRACRMGVRGGPQAF